MACCGSNATGSSRAGKKGNIMSNGSSSKLSSKEEEKKHRFQLSPLSISTRYFILTRDYLHCFKRASGSATERISDMGQFIFKVSLPKKHNLNNPQMRVHPKAQHAAVVFCVVLPILLPCGHRASGWRVVRVNRERYLLNLYPKHHRPTDNPIACVGKHTRAS